MDPLEEEVEALIDPEDPSQVASPSKLGKRKGSLDYYKTGMAAHMLALRRMTEMPVLPSEAGCLDMPAEYQPQENTSKKRQRFTDVRSHPLIGAPSLRRTH